MSVARPLRRLLGMTRDELTFRARCEARKTRERGWVAIGSPRWRRGAFASLIVPQPRNEELRASRHAAVRRDWPSAHRALAAHIAARESAFPLVPARIPDIAGQIAGAFPDAAADAAARADRMLAGSYDLLGYRHLKFGTPPRWNVDPVHGREAPSGFWASLPYLDPACGDHKVIWEINRHQHFLALARAFHLTRERRYYETFVDHLEDWIHRNPPLRGINWASMLELAFRTLSWLWALHFFAPAAMHDGDADPPWTIDLVVALDRQLDHVEHNLSRYFSPNTHLSGEALGLYVCGTCLPELRASGRRASLGRDVLAHEATRQIRGDGGHVELSAHYHRYSTDFYLLALSVARASSDGAEAAFEVAARRQSDFLRTLSDDNGRLPLLGDDDGGQLFPICNRPPSDCRDTLAAASILLDRPDLRSWPVPEEAYWLCGSRTGSFVPGCDPTPALPRQSVELRESGYYVMRSAPGDHLVFDAGPHGYLNGGHAHADALAIVLTAGGEPLLVDPGTATYTMDPVLRDRFRSTAMHNTVVVNGRSQSEPRGPFQWRTRASARAPVWRPSRRFDYVEGVHDGYAPVVHARAVLAVRGVGWLVVDHLLGSGHAVADANWHIHPDWTASLTRAGALLRHHTGRGAIFASSAAVAFDTSGLDRYAPEYGRIVPAPCLTARTTGPLPRSFATFIVMEASAASVSPIPVRIAPPDAWYAAAFRLTWDGHQGELMCAIERDGAAADPAAAPAVPWGTASVLTNARVALHSRSLEPILVNGDVLASSVHRAGQQLIASRS